MEILDTDMMITQAMVVVTRATEAVLAVDTREASVATMIMLNSTVTVVVQEEEVHTTLKLTFIISTLAAAHSTATREEGTILEQAVVMEQKHMVMMATLSKSEVGDTTFPTLVLVQVRLEAMILEVSREEVMIMHMQKLELLHLAAIQEQAMILDIQELEQVQVQLTLVVTMQTLSKSEAVAMILAALTVLHQLVQNRTATQQLVQVVMVSLAQDQMVGKCRRAVVMEQPSRIRESTAIRLVSHLVTTAVITTNLISSSTFFLRCATKRRECIF
jgi:hypothetical protein